jgi:hypothetical protein
MSACISKGRKTKKLMKATLNSTSQTSKLGSLEVDFDC